MCNMDIVLSVNMWSSIDGLCNFDSWPPCVTFYKMMIS
ncbi:unnamed protein product, partial [Urochloa humidicola]